MLQHIAAWKKCLKTVKVAFIRDRAFIGIDAVLLCFSVCRHLMTERVCYLVIVAENKLLSVTV